ncbi:double-strand break repair protein MRE11-like [Trifolium medium]|uniref:Double-strand break repair protein MRE11-like n=1 Tax=Trifolium medium TaxID=97028 RepID=A0A392NB20_9FABA|nr:double-strand break repair protein MRE11-like [Trifolium medium]
MQIVLKDMPDIDSNDQNSILEHLDKVVEKLLEKSSKNVVQRAELKLPLVRIKEVCSAIHDSIILLVLI